MPFNRLYLPFYSLFGLSHKFKINQGGSWERGGGHFLQWHCSAPRLFSLWLAGRDASERGKKEKKKMKWYVAVSIDRLGLLIRKWREMEGGGGGKRRGERNDVVLCLSRRATRGGYPHEQLGGAWGIIRTGAKLGHPRLSRPRHLPRGAAFINSSWWEEVLRSIFTAGVFQPGTSI